MNLLGLGLNRIKFCKKEINKSMKIGLLTFPRLTNTFSSVSRPTLLMLELLELAKEFNLNDIAWNQLLELKVEFF